jgi:hypothetical protein
MSAGPEGASRLVFQWPERWHPTLALPGLILLAAALHFGAVLVFDLVYPTAGVGKVERGVVFQWSHPTPVGHSPQWDNPALFSPARGDRSLPEVNFPVNYLASFDQPLVALERPGRSPSELLLPHQQVLPPIDLSASSVGLIEGIPEVRVGVPRWKSAWAVSGDFAPPLENGQGSIPEDLQGAAVGQWWVGVNREGVPQAVFSLRTSASEGWEQAAREWLRGKNFRPRLEAEGAKGRVLFWGLVELRIEPVEELDVSPAPEFTP